MESGFICCAILALDLIFVASTSLKIASGGWVPILIGAVLFTILMTWKDGRALVLTRLEQDALPIDLFIKSISMGTAPSLYQGMLFS